MTKEQYKEIMQELNFYDNSVGINQITLKDIEQIEEVVTEFNYIPIGYYETENTQGYKFKDDQNTYSIHEHKDGLRVYELLEL